MEPTDESGPIVRVIPVVSMQDLPPSDFWDALETVLRDYEEQLLQWGHRPEDDPDVRALRAGLVMG